MKFPEPNEAIKRRDDKTGYETPIGTLPSVTTILSATSFQIESPCSTDCAGETWWFDEKIAA